MDTTHTQAELCLKYFLNILSKRDYSEYQLRQKGKLRNYDDVDINHVINHLKTSKFLNDQRLAENFVEVNRTQKGRQWLIQKLTQKGISQDMIDISLGDLSSDIDPNIKLVIQRKYQITDWTNLDDKTKRKVMNYLSYRGFNNAYEILTKWQSCN